MRKGDDEVSLDELALTYLAQFVGQQANDSVLASLHAEGFEGLRTSHGYVFQHLTGGTRRVTEIARLMGVTQQAASKIVSELVSLGYVELGVSDDARARNVTLSKRGKQALARARSLRRKLERTMTRGCSTEDVATARAVLRAMFEAVGGVDAVKRRRVRDPSVLCRATSVTITRASVRKRRPTYGRAEDDRSVRPPMAA